MKERNIKVSLEEAKKWYKGDVEALKELALQAFTEEELNKKKLPESWEEYLKDETLLCVVNNRLDVINLRHLLTLRDVYRDMYKPGWKPDWNDASTKFTIEYRFDYLVLDFAVHYAFSLFSFPTQDLAKQFLENFKEQLEQVLKCLL